MDAAEKLKLNEMFHIKFQELCFSNSKDFSTWRMYLESLSCLQSDHSGLDQVKEDQEFINDPSPFGKEIVMSKETARKILVLGLP